jgi:hypothetical protein
MKKYFLIAAGLSALDTNAQTVSTAGFKLLSVESVGSMNVIGKPVSATQERHTLQVLGDGTRIENTQTEKFYRDDAGRTRLERHDGTVIIQDPVQGVTAEVNQIGGVTVHRTKPQGHDEKTKDDEHKLKKPDHANATGQEEDLGYQSVNGVTVRGSRSVTTIPVGQIGNDRPIQIISERWYSEDLQMNVKAVNSDPRFGETTYQLTNIAQNAPDPSLFQIPANARR